MSIDMQQFNAVFFEEVSEHLTNMESLLLGIEVTSPSLEDLNAIFRAAHSIKGGAGIFGFDDMTEVTHILETLLDKLRKEELTLTTEMIDVFLQAGDILAAQKEVHQEGVEAVDEVDVKAVCERLATLSSGEYTAIEKVENAQTIAILEDKQISFLVATGDDPDNLFSELSEHGQLTKHSEVLQGFIKWQLDLFDCNVTNEELFDSISFIADPDTILIKKREDTEESSFGFFDGIKTVISNSEEQDQGFGFFNDIESIVDSNENSEQQEEDGFGLFSEKSSAENITDNALQRSNNSTTSQEEDGFGLYAEEHNRPCKAPEKTTKSKKIQKVVANKTSPLQQKNNKRPTNKSNSTSETSIRVNTEKVDQLINQVGELVITQAMLMQISNDLDPSEHDVLLNRLIQLERNTRDLQESVMSIRMMPISFVFGRFPRVVRDLSSKLNKKIDLRMVGNETELDKGLVEQLSDPLTHLIRNSIDHGIEMPEQRIANGKPETGVITLHAFYEGGNVVINISDDGAGLNRDKILEKALERGLDVNHNMSDNDIYQLIFSAGFSTAEKVTDVSGRGVGMDVVKRNIHAMGGQVDIHSEAGIGSTISIRLPLTLAILDGMSISVAGQIYIIPLTFISESLQPQPDDIKSINGKGMVVKVRDDYIPLLALHQLFNIDTEIKQASDGILVLLESNNKKIALLVDQLEGQQQVVLKSLETNFHAVPCISGATIMGDGTVALILDVAGLVSESD